jgi:ATP/ADP translocase
MTLTAEPRTASTSTAVERKGWILVGLLAVVMILFGLMAFFSESGRSTPITGSKCCNGERFDTVAAWAFDYTAEITQYMASYMFATGVLALVLVLVPLRRHERWAWAVLWIVPGLFALHGFALGSFPFDIAPLVLSALGLLLMARPVFSDSASGERVRQGTR